MKRVNKENKVKQKRLKVVIQASNRCSVKGKIVSVKKILRGRAVGSGLRTKHSEPTQDTRVLLV